MALTQTRNAEMQMLGSADHLFAKDRNFCFSAYNSGSDLFTSTITLSLNTVVLNHAPEIFSFASNILTILVPGVYLLRAHGTFAMTGGVAGQSVMTIDEDPATGTFANVLPSTQTYTYLPANLNASWETTVVALVKANYRYRLSAARTSGSATITTVNGTTSLLAVLLYNNE